MVAASSQWQRQEVERGVRERVGRRVRQLDIDFVADTVILRGRATSYHVKQLAQQGVCDVVPDARVQNQIVVERSMSFAEV